MRALFSLIGLVLVLGVIGMAAKKQLNALGFGHVSGMAAASAPAGTGGGSRMPTPGAVSGYEAADPGGAAPQAPRQIVERARVDVQRAVEQGAANRAPD
jgi:hypothetical protein